MGEKVERDRTWLVHEPLLCFVLDETRFAVSVIKLATGKRWTWQEARDEVVGRFPDLDEHFTAAEIIVPELENE